jgi:NAD(P)-dependent dehydrogenase (short-subunit alcohol dehydrogenase family)
MPNILIVGGDSAIGNAIHTLVPNSVCTSRRADSEYIFLDVENTLPNFENKFDQIYYCIAVNNSDLKTIDINAVLSYRCLEHLAKYVNSGGVIRVLTSIVGSFTKGKMMPANQADIYYRMSKAALNIGVCELSNIYTDINWQLVHPGFVKTKLTMNLSYINQADDPIIAAEKIVNLPVIQGMSYVELDTSGTRLIL